MAVQVTKDAEFGTVVDLFVKLVKDERGHVILGELVRRIVQQPGTGSQKYSSSVSPASLLLVRWNT